MTRKETDSKKESNRFTEDLADANNVKQQVGDSLWKYFDITDKERRVAKCVFCEELVSYKDDQRGLADHLLIMHTIHVQDPLGGSEPVKVKKVNVQPRLGLNIRDFFGPGEREQDNLVVCCLCGDSFPNKKSYDQMVKHMSEKHNIVEDTRQSRESSEEEERDARPRKRERSIAWNYFTLHDKFEKTAACNLCGTVCSYRSSITNLLKHVQRKHRNGSVPPVKRRRVNISKAWAHFKQLDNDEKTALCLVCKKSFSYATSVSNLRKHVCRKHPGLVDSPGDYTHESELHSASEDHAYGKELQPGAAHGGDSQQEQNESDAVEVEYLEVYQDDLVEVPDNILHERKPDTDKSPDKKPVLNHRRAAQRVSTAGAESAAAESVDHFGPYLISLLKQLPRSVSNRLQVEFVRQVIEAQAMCDANA